MENDSILNIINNLNNNFNINSIEDYQKLLLIIYNELFIYEDISSIKIKYALYSIINSIITKINKNNNETHFTMDDLYYLIIQPDIFNIT